MPLKHRTETFLVVILAMAIMLTGIVVATLPALPYGLIPWVIVFIATLVYPIVLYPLFKADRADYEFRTLHWVPAALALLWLVLQVAALLVPQLRILGSIYTWAWLLPAVSLAILALLLFCTKVIRQWTKRIFLVLLLFVPFATLALWSSTGPHIENTLAQVLWNNAWGESIVAATKPLLQNIGYTGESVSSSVSSEAVSESEGSMIALEKSSDPNEQKWRDFIADYENSAALSSEESSIITGESSSVEEGSQSSSKPGGILGFFTGDDNEVDSSSSSSVSSVVSSSSSSAVLIGQTSSVPTKLTDSGFGWAFIILSMISMYCAVLHRRQTAFA